MHQQHKHVLLPQHNICHKQSPQVGYRGLVHFGLPHLLQRHRLSVRLPCTLKVTHWPRFRRFFEVWSCSGIPRFCESVFRSCFACGTCWLFLLCTIVKAFSAAAANQKPYPNEELYTRKSAKTNCWQCVTLKPSRSDWKHVLNACTKLAKSGEYHLVNARKAHTSTTKRGGFNPKAQTFPHSGKVQHRSTNLIAPARQPD